MSNEEPPLHLSDLQIDDGEKEKPVRSAAVEQDEREEALRAELAGVQQINSIIEGVVSSLEKAKENMETVSTTVASANTLLDLWIRILSQTEHTQRLLLSGHWEGATQDLNDIEAEAAAKVQEAERRREEERERAAAREREAVAAEARRATAERKPTRGARRAGGSGAGRSGSSGGSRIGAPTSSSSSSGTGTGRGTRGGRGSRGGSGIGRGGLPRRGAK
ncbi:DASH complex subunit Duo1-domain-containing protein [Tuber brumale]|nr:DASH complex subunit Duo1-domain-containing protein [Tuber brumale]